MKRTLLFAPLAVASLIAGCGGQPTELRPPERAVSVEELYRTFSTNEIAAKRDFAKSPFRLTGNVAHISDEGRVLFRVGGGLNVGLDLPSASKSKLAEVSEGDALTVDCEGAKYALGMVAPQDCRFTDN